MQKYPTDLNSIQTSTKIQKLQITVQQLEKEILELKNERRFIFDLNPIPYVMLTMNGVVLKCNLAFTHLLKKNFPQIENRPFIVHVDGNFHESFIEFYRMNNSSKTALSIEIKLLSNNGARKNIKMMSLQNHNNEEIVLLSCQDIDKEVKEREKMEKMAYKDGLTGLDNRRSMDIYLKDTINISKRYREKFAFILIDVDGFKNINDYYGHDIGDAVLKYIASILKKITRKGNIVSRIGGDEFAIIITKIELADDLLGIFKRLQTI